MQEHVVDLIPGYALNALSHEEQRSVQLHLAHCATCRTELVAYQFVVDQLALAAPEFSPPPRLKQAILGRIDTQPLSPSAPVWQNWLENLRRRLVSLLPASPTWSLVSLILILVLAGSNLALWQQMRGIRQEQTEYRMVSLEPTQSALGSSGLLVISPGGRFGALIVDGLTNLPENRQYQLWLIKDGKRTSGGVFSVIQGGYGVLRVNAPEPLIDFQSFGITIEPFGGSPRPTGDKVLGGSL